ncbi:MAG: 4-alpha-glucanotransferase [Pseudomonadota bacterium]
MSADDTLRQLAEACGIHLAYDSWTGDRQRAEPPTLRALLGALGVETGSDAAVAEALGAREAAASARHLPVEQVIDAGHPFEFPTGSPCDWSVIDADGAELQAGRGTDGIALPPLPVGYFTLSVRGPGWTDEVFLLSRPAAAPDLTTLSGTRSGWGVSGALYGLRSSTNGGLGNYADLAQAMRALAQAGAQYFGINPIHALGWAATDTISPYSPSHRGFLNTDHIATDAGLGPGPEGAQIDYAAFRQRHRQALAAEFDRFENTAAQAEKTAFAAFRAAGGTELDCFVRFETTSERHGADFRDWPGSAQDPDNIAADPRDRFHAWLQWRADTQVEAAQNAARAAGMPLGLYLDLAVGARIGGAEVWMHQDIAARGVSIGAPPDHLSPAGQSWTLAAYAPNKLAQNRYEPVRTLLKRLMAKAGIIRIDHALGLMRSFWVPDDGSPGGYISQPFSALLAVVAIEAWQNNCLVVGEDLGLVPPGFRKRLNQSGLYSYAVWQYETEADGALYPARHLRPFSMACFGTHDTPTIQGFWRGRDIEWWRTLDWLNSEQTMNAHGSRARQRNSLRTHCGIEPDARPDDIRAAIHTGLAQSPAALVTVQLDDVFGCEQAQNLPGTIDAHPNWRRPMPVAVEGFAASRALAQTGALMSPARDHAAPQTHKEPDTCPS